MELRSLSNKRPIIRGLVNGQQAAFLVDTGASVGLIDMNSPLGLAKGRKFHGTLVGQGGAFEAKYMCNTPVQFGSKMISQFIMADIDSVKYSIADQTGIMITGILSWDQIKMLGITITANEDKFIL